MVSVDARPDTTEIDLDGITDEKTGVRYMGKARCIFGQWRCLAVVGEALCIVELRVRPTMHVDADPGDEDCPARDF